jgi:O-antigen ligase
VITSVIKEKGLFALLALFFICSIAAAAFTGACLIMVVPFAILLLYTGWQHRNLLFYLLIFSLPFSFEYNFSSGLGTDIPDELLMWLVSIIFFAAWIYSPKEISKNILQHPLLLLLMALLCWTTVTVLFSSNLQLSLKFLLAKGWYAGAFILAPVMAIKNKQSIIALAAVLTGAMVLVMLTALVKHSGNGFSFATINDAVAPFFRNHVNYSAMLVCIFPVMAAFWKFNKQKSVRHFLTLLLVLMAAALFFSYARGAWVALLAGIIAYRMIKQKKILLLYTAAIAMVLAALFWLKQGDRYLQYSPDFTTTIYHSNFNEHLLATYQLKDVSTAERFYRWIAGLRMIKDNGFTGYGPATFYNNYKQYTIPAYKTWVSNNPEHSTVHNYYLLTAIEQGIPGLLFLLFLAGAMLYYAQYLYHRIQDALYKTVVITVGVILVMILVLNFLSDLVETDKIGSLFFLCIAMLVLSDNNTREAEPPGQSGELNPSPHIKGIP